MDRELRVRQAAFEFLAQRCPEPDDTIHWRDLQSRFIVDGEPVILIGQKGIWKPKQLDLPISLITAPPKPNKPAPYDDHVTDDGLLAYRYRGDNPSHPDNIAVRRCFQDQVPLIYFHGIEKSIYLPVWPVFVVADSPGALTFTIAVEDPIALRPDLTIEQIDPAQRRYTTQLVKRRVHQAAFRERVLAAYRRTCAICRLNQAELLEAAHIIPDSSFDGDPVVPNGLSLCTIHHAAFDRHILGIRPDLVIELRQDILDAIDGPMLRYGLQGFHGEKLLMPRSATDRPDADRLERRYEEFRTIAA
ncbi:MAG: HNH endonuclease [Acidimicrobiales bacterium]